MQDQPLPSNYSLLIQGPVLSIGRTGKTLFEDTLTAHSIVRYNSEENLLKLLADFGHLFSEVLIVTWSNEKIDASKFSSFKNCRILLLDDIIPAIVIDNKKLATDFNNKHKQFYALSKGIEQLSESKAHFIVKTRTDQYLDLKALIAEHQQSLTASPANISKIFVPYINRNNYLVSDFYFVAPKVVFEKFVNSMLWNNYLEFNASVHIDMSLKYAYLHHRDQIQVNNRTYFLNSFSKNMNQDKIKLLNYLTHSVYEIMSSNMIDTMTWRGDTMALNASALSSFVFSDRNKKLLLFENNYRKSGLKDLLYINLPSYLVVRFPFLRNTFAESLIRKSYSVFIKIFKK